LVERRWWHLLGRLRLHGGIALGSGFTLGSAAVISTLAKVAEAVVVVWHRCLLWLYGVI
jgi:hypothetical protein